MNISFDLITLGIIAFTSIFSVICFQDEAKLHKYSFMPFQIRHYREHYRFLSHAFVHADAMHLIFNMYGLYVFGDLVEDFFKASFTDAIGEVVYLVFYTTAIYAASLPQFMKEKDNRYFSSIGASGAVNAIVFSFIVIAPTAELSLFFAIPFKAWMFGLIYLGASYLLAKRKANNPHADRIDHSAHFWGAAYGIIFTCSVKPELISEFFRKIAGGH